MNRLKNGAKFYLEIASALLTLLFIYTGINKLMDFQVFSYQLSYSPLLSKVGMPLGRILPAFEIVLALSLVFKKTNTIGLITSCCLLFAFTIYLVIMVSFFKHLPCTCGGVISKMSWKQHIAFNIFFLIMSFVAVRMKLRTNKNNYHALISSSIELKSSQ